MQALQKIEKEIQQLPVNEYSSFRKWFQLHDNEIWDKEIKVDSASGALDFLIDEAIKEKETGKLRAI